MHLNRLKIRRFRSCEDVTVPLRKDLTVLVGENNGGKSNVVDAIRLLTAPLNGRRERYPEEEDFRRGASPANFEVVGEYVGLSDTLKGLLITAVPDPIKDSAILGFRFETPTTALPRGRTIQWAGKFDAAEPERGSTDLVRHVYLPALRDAHQALGSGSGTRVMALLRHFIPKGDERAFVDAVRRGSERPGLLNTMNKDIGSSLGALTGGVRPQQARLDFAEESLLDVARALRFKLADAGFALDDIRASGLGYSNLLYMATVAVELAKSRESDLTLFLVEEPEAHLHPQLQMLVLEFLLEQARESQASPLNPGQPEGRIQVIVTTHSPNLTAWVSPKHLVVLRSRRSQVSPGPPTPSTPTPEGTGPPEADQASKTGPLAAAPSSSEPSTTVQTVAIAVARLEMDDGTLEKIGRYLDVTRSAMLFGSSALLVEGIAESLLLPVLARTLVLASDRAALHRFKGTVLVPIEGVDFNPYVEVLLRSYNGARIADRVVVITDRDPTMARDRKASLEQLAIDVGAAGALFVYTNTYTLEHELMLTGNEDLLKRAFLTVHPKSQANWKTYIEDVALTDRPLALLKLIRAQKTPKGELMQEIVARIEAGETFQVPTYLRQALKKVAEP